MLHEPRHDLAGQRLLEGDATIVLPGLAEGSVDLVYLDPPFGNRQEWRGKAGSFSDIWKTSRASECGWAALEWRRPDCARVFAGLDDADRAYIGTMAGLLIQCHRVMKLTATLWLHHDATMGAYLRVLGDLVFGAHLNLGTMVWRRSHSHSNARGFGNVHDTVGCWMRSRYAELKLWKIGIIPGERQPDELEPIALGGFFTTPPLAQAASERVGYPTQKPVALIEEIITAASLPGDLVLDPTCGSGTTLIAARNLNRRAIGIDLSTDAIAAAHERLRRAAPIQAELFA